MPVTLKTCAYIKCDLGENGERKQKWMTESGIYCCPKHAQYQRRLDKQKATQEYADLFCGGDFNKAVQILKGEGNDSASD